MSDGHSMIDNMQDLLFEFINRTHSTLTLDEARDCDWFGIDIIFDYSREHERPMPFARYLCFSKSPMRCEGDQFGWEWLDGLDDSDAIPIACGSRIPITPKLSNRLKNHLGSEYVDYVHTLIEASIL